MTNETRIRALVTALMIPSVDLGTLVNLFESHEELLSELTRALDLILQAYNTDVVFEKYNKRLCDIISFMDNYASYALLRDFECLSFLEEAECYKQ